MAANASTKWFFLACLFFYGASAIAIFVLGSAVPFETAEFFDVPVSKVNLFNILSKLLSALIFNPVAILLTEFKGPGKTLLVTAVISALICVFRLAAIFLHETSAGYGLFFVSYILLSFISSTFLINTLKVIALWFPDGTRAFANVFGTLSNPLGSLFGFITSAIFIRGKSESEGDDLEKMFLYQTLSCVVLVA